MALPDPHPSPIEVWKSRAKKTILTFFVLLAHFLVFYLLLMRDRVAGFFIAPILCYGVWQLVCKIVSGEGFSPLVAIRIEKSEDLRNVLFTVFFALNSVFYMYHVYSAPENWAP